MDYKDEFQTDGMPKGLEKAFITPTGGNAFKTKSLNALLGSIVDTYFAEHHISKNTLVPAVARRKRIFLYISAFLNLILLSLLFFHFNIWVTVLFLLNIMVAVLFQLTYKSKKYIIKQIKAHPDEKFNYVIANVTATGIDVKPTKKTIPNVFVMIACVLSILLPLIFFFQPRFFYEPFGENAYYVRYYTMGVVNPGTIEVPSTYNGKNVVGLRGDVFANVFTARKVVLPDTIDTIRGNAFENMILLQEIELPNNLTYLGGGAFRNCISLIAITIPDSVIEMQGETFYGCSSLRSVVLSNRLTEIRGNTFEECSSLEAIVIPEGVVRIGGHAFYGCYSLSSVTFPSTLREIGSSAFRECDSLEEVTIPSNTNVNERAFKDSPTNVNYEPNFAQ